MYSIKYELYYYVTATNICFTPHYSIKTLRNVQVSTYDRYENINVAYVKRSTLNLFRSNKLYNIIATVLCIPYTRVYFLNRQLIFLQYVTDVYFIFLRVLDHVRSSFSIMYFLSHFQDTIDGNTLHTYLT